jgi:hypothetical protein
MSTRYLSGGGGGRQPHWHLWVDCLRSMGASTSHNRTGLHGLLHCYFPPHPSVTCKSFVVGTVMTATAPNCGRGRRKFEKKKKKKKGFNCRGCSWVRNGFSGLSDPSGNNIACSWNRSHVFLANTWNICPLTTLIAAIWLQYHPPSFV